MKEVTSLSQHRQGEHLWSCDAQASEVVARVRRYRVTAKMYCEQTMREPVCLFDSNSSKCFSCLQFRPMRIGGMGGGARE